MSECDKEYTYIDLFSGCGGLALGMNHAGWKGLFAIEKNEDALNATASKLYDAYETAIGYQAKLEELKLKGYKDTYLIKR